MFAGAKGDVWSAYEGVRGVKCQEEIDTLFYIGIMKGDTNQTGNIAGYIH